MSVVLLVAFLASGVQNSLSGWPHKDNPSSHEQREYIPDTFFSLRTYGHVMYNGMEVYICEDAASCEKLNELDTSHGVARLKDGRYVGLRRRTDPAGPRRVGTLQEVSGGRLVKWPRIASVSPRSLPQIQDYVFVRAYQLLATDAYVGLWHRSGRGSGSQTVVVLFDGGKVEGSGLSAKCGPYRILASVDRRVDLLEVRPIHHVGEAINLASHDPRSKALWVARMILPETAVNCG